MNSHMLIEPDQLIKMQMHHSSKVYKHYHSFLRTTSNKPAAELTKDFCLNSSFTSIDDQLACYEFLYMNDYLDELTTLLQSSCQHLEAVYLYETLLKIGREPMSMDDLKSFESLSFEHPSLKCFHLFLLIYMYYDLKRYTVLDKYTEACYITLHKVREPLFYYYMSLRFDELSFQHYWKTNNLILARKYAFKYISKVLAPRKLCSMHHNLSQSYVFESFPFSMHHAKQALQIALQHDFPSEINSIKHNTIPFIAAYHRRTLNVSTPDVVETAHIALAENKKDRAVEILSSLQSLTPFQESYLGLATGNSPMLDHAHERFRSEYGDLFFCYASQILLK